MERLIKKIEKYIEAYQLPPFGREVDGTVELLQEVLKKLAEYKDLEEQDLLLRLPCKVGDIVYRIINQRDNYDDTVYQIASATIFELSMIDKIGKTVFLTQVEAEQKLKEMKNK